MTSLFKNWRTTFERIDKYLSDTYFTDVNLTKMINLEIMQVTKLCHLITATNPKLSSKDSLELFDESALSFNDVLSYNDEHWESVEKASFSFGKTWSIHWFRVEFDVPVQWTANKTDHIIEFQWNSECEVLLFSHTGRVVQGLNATHSRTSIDIADIEPIGDLKYLIYLQASCSDLFGAGNNGLINPPNLNKTFKIETAQIRLIFYPALILFRDLGLLLKIAESMKETENGYRALYVANEAVNKVVDLKNIDFSYKIKQAQELLNAFFAERYGGHRFTLHAMGHCHIDTAWLWRYGETRRKLARSWSTTLQLLEKYPHMTFVCSQAQQLDWLKQDYPDLFTRLQKLAQRKQFIPVGGTWVEMDVNLPCTESLCRQFLYGQRFFKKNFGKYCFEFWLPDTFGYSPQLPQIMKLSNISRFVTQKLSWSLVNKFPHHTFVWQGLDGSQVLAHFPPGDSYSMTCSVSEIMKSAVNFADKGRSSVSMFLYGHGDGGQGPTEEMVYNLDRLKDYDGLPKVCHSSPDQFFTKLEKEDLDKLCVWKGELFLELHNGTYTTQRQIKLGNVHCEQMMRAVELMISIVLCHSKYIQGDQDYKPFSLISDEIEIQWKKILLNQFHDVLPGSSIEQVCDDAYWSHRSVLRWCCDSIQMLASMIAITCPFLVNPTSWPLTMSCIPNSPVIPPHSVMAVPEIFSPDIPIGVDYKFDSLLQMHLLTNQFFTISVDNHCRIRRLRLLSQPEFMNIIPHDCPANQIMIFDDVPLFWDAWDVMDYHLETGVDIECIPSFRILQEIEVVKANNSISLLCKFRLENTQTTIEQSITIYGHVEYCHMCTKIIEWNEIHKMMKVKIPTVVNSTDAQYCTQTGYLSRPTHRNTSWDSAKFEVCGHDWIHIGEANWGVSVLKEAIFGSSVMDGTFFLSLLRSPNSPDATADKKHIPHVFNYAIFPYDSSSTNNRFGTISRLAIQYNWMCAWKTNLSDSFPTHIHQPSLHNLKLFPISVVEPNNGELSIDWIKPTCDNPHRFLLRLHEISGGRYVVKLASSVAIKHVYIANILEECKEDTNNASNDIIFTNNAICLFVLPFTLISIVVEFI